VRWKEAQRDKLRALGKTGIALPSGLSQKEVDREAQEIADLYMEVFHRNADPLRRFWNTVSIHGSGVRAGRLPHEWRSLLWEALGRYRSRCFTFAMVARYDPARRMFLHHWVSVTLGPVPAPFGPRTVALDPWLHTRADVFAPGEHDPGNWMGTTVDPDLGPGGTLVDDQGRPFGGDWGPLQ
jgi:hypothetical protein